MSSLENQNRDLENLNLGNSLEERISNLENSISNEFNITIDKLKEVAEFKSSKSLDQLKDELQNIDGIKENTNYTIFAEKVLELHKLRNETLREVEKLRADIFEGNLKDCFKKEDLTIGNMCSKELLEKCNKPTCKKDEVLGLCLGTIESCATIGKTGYDIVKDTLRLPLDLIDIVKGKKEYDGFKNI